MEDLSHPWIPVSCARAFYQLKSLMQKGFCTLGNANYRQSRKTHLAFTSRQHGNATDHQKRGTPCAKEVSC
ncbi:hypothetical protein EMEDMD4_270025 [Sinorhizobium medicae]|uniref:Uncharacterized protein n=1 Tax=Sinorhizobium medicae TaxID=110321 RepID=A0A508WWT8_9HYPH|nr:hypothetical protein EMEDMD4_270025 [Sinorhizobium medicae]